MFFERQYIGSLSLECCCTILLQRDLAIPPLGHQILLNPEDRIVLEQKPCKKPRFYETVFLEFSKIRQSGGSKTQQVEAAGTNTLRIVTLSTDERETLRNLINSGTHRARKITHARILLKADEGWLDWEISSALEVGISTIERVRQRFVLEGLEAALKMN